MSEIVEIFQYWQERCQHPGAKLSNDRRDKIKARLNEGYTVNDIRLAIDGAAVRPFKDPITGRVFDDIELICRKGSKLEDFMARVKAMPMRPQALQRADGYLSASEYEGRR